MDNAVFTKLQHKYGVSEAYLSAYLRKMLGREVLGEEDLQQELSSNPNLANWLDYALSTNTRGRFFVEVLRPHIRPNARRYLDVGSAYGGFLVAFLEQGLEVVGLEYDPALIPLCNANLQECGVTGVYKTVHGSILDQDLPEQLGTFDIITCIDVIEHVSDVPLAMQHMVQLLNPGGMIVLQIPNKDSISSVISDGHFGLFGITLLQHHDAEQLFSYRFPDKTYDVGEYYDSSYYLASLCALGCEASMLEPVYRPRTIEKIKLARAYVHQLFRFCFMQTNLPLKLKTKVAARATFHLISFLLQSGFVFFVRKRLGDYKAKFIDDVWLILGRKPAA